MIEKIQLRFGILCNNLMLQRWQVEIIRQLRAEGQLPALIILNTEVWDKNKPVQTAGKKYFNNLLYRFYNRFIFRSKWRQTIDMTSELHQVPQQQCKVRTRGYSQFFSAEDVEYIRSQDLDFMLRFGFNIIRGEILTAARYGIWSYHHGDEQQFRGGPPGFWEIYKSNRITGAVLQRLTPELDAGVTLKKSWYATVRHSYTEQLDRIIGGSIPMVSQVCFDIVCDNADYLDAPSSNTKARIYRVPGNLTMAVFLLKIIRNRLFFNFRDLFMCEQWNLGLIDASPIKVAFNWRRYRGRVRWFKPLPPTHFRADPFFFRSNNIPYIACERFDYRKGKGHIELITLSKEHQVETAHIALQGKEHFSFPFTFSKGNDIFCIPETSATGQTNLFKFDSEIGNFSFERRLMDIPLIDPVLVDFEDRWWLFATLPGNSSGALFIWHTHSLDEPFEPHPANPVKTDINSSRPAGPFIKMDGYLYRPAQNASRTYGGSLVINQVIILNTNEYVEQPVVELKPDLDWLYSSGMHTISGDEKITVIDAKRFRFVPAATWNKLKLKLKFIKSKTQ